jgi:hypothetical protein
MIQNKDNIEENFLGFFDEKQKIKMQSNGYTCIVCNKTFKEKGNLKTHERIHVITLLNVDWRKTIYLRFQWLCTEI